MGKHRHQQQYRRTVVAAVAVGVIGIPSVAMACTDWPDGGQREDRATAVPSVGEDRWDGPGWYGRWRSQHDADPTPVASDSPSASASPSKDARAKHGGKPSHKPKHTHEPKKKATKPASAAPSTASAAPRPSTAAPKPSTVAPAPTTPAPAPTTAAPKPTATASGAVARVVELVNAERAEAGCSPVTANSTLNTAAQRHSEDMASTGTMSHTGSDGSDPGARITRAGYTWSTYGENVAYGYSTPEQVMQGWMTSPGHKANILNCSFKEIGVGLSGTYWTQDFGTAR
ncbi:CAP domain-containing protein [Streptomyces sp. Vc74B-19]|uniref:CAP domain-containing protein n=1 Tax=Streptomyces sp. Vc74B-19 TaxID=2741324 RepID=UPI001BFCB51E|nr:CAP domain-containing protein [Streptomyces sp. Vc74B-19]MBT3166269.1 CAP domain-containing protein [Streptomyces sp. Vc74B-19]